MSVGPLLRSMRHTRPRQLAWRAALLLRRRAMERVPALRPVYDAPAPRPAPDPPAPRFAPRRHLVRGDELLLAGDALPLTIPLVWEPPADAPVTRLGRLTLHSMEWLEALDDAAVAAAIDDWIRANPPWGPAYWLRAWNSFALSIRCVVWMQQLAVRRGLPPDLRRRALASLAAQVRFLEANLELDIRGNHLVKNVKALLWAARFFEGDEPRCWSRTGRALLREVLDDQILPDGLHDERSPAYHAQVLADLIECHQVLEPGDLRAALAARLAAMGQALADLTHPDGLPALWNDGGLHMAYAPGACLDALAGETGHRVAPRPAFALREAGYFGLRAPGELLVVDCGPVGPDHLPAHAHGDILALEWSLGGRRVLVDAGVFQYDPGPWRAHSRATRSHSTVTVDDQDQCEFWSSFRVGRRARVRLEEAVAETGRLVVAGSHDGYRHLAGSPRHGRRVVASPGAIDVADRVEGGAGQPVRARLLLHPDVVARATAGRVELACEDVRIELRTQAPVSLEDAWYCPDFGTRHATRQIVLDYGPAPCEGGFTLRAADPARVP